MCQIAVLLQENKRSFCVCLFVCFIVLKYLDQSKGSGVRLLGFNATTDAQRPNDLGSVTEPLSTCFLPCKGLVITGTIVIGV